MIIQLGHFALILATCMALAQACLPIFGMLTGRNNFMAVAAPAAVGQFLLVGLSFLALGYAFYTNDFSVAYVAANSNSHLPWYYRVTAIWGAHEGSLLLWIMILNIWSVAVVFASKSLPREISSCVLAVMGTVNLGFLLFTLFTSNPFLLELPAPMQGRDLNPLLQDPGLVFHPPMLYMGYVGFTVAFAFAITALITGRVDSAWTRWTRPWTLAAWMFLTVGIVFGSKWAYYELGWGGWWFWDSVENASFMPWLLGTALIHSLAVTEVRGIFKSWTVLLALAAFAMTLLGTFLVRSGVLISVHAFALDPTRGIYILIFLGIVIGSSLLLYAWRAPRFEARQQVPIKPLSREGLLLLNNIFLVVATAAVLLGTMYPIIAAAMGMGRISVGPPYFNSVFIPLTVPLGILVGFAAVMAWKKTGLSTLRDRLWLPLVCAIVLGVALAFVSEGTVGVVALAGSVLGGWIICASLAEVVRRIRGHKLRMPRATLGMTLAHTGVGVFVIGVTLVSVFGIDVNARMSPGDSVDVAGNTYTFDGTHDATGANYKAVVGQFTVTHDGRQLAVLHPEKREYQGKRGVTTTEAGIQSGILNDLYASMGRPSDDGSWTVRLYYRPFVHWIWAGGLLAAFGGFLSLTDKRYWRQRKRRRSGVATGRRVEA